MFLEDYFKLQLSGQLNCINYFLFPNQYIMEKNNRDLKDKGLDS